MFQSRSVKKIKEWVEEMHLERCIGSVSGRVLLVPKGAFSPPSFIGKGPFIVMYSAGRVMRVCALHEARSISEDLLRSVVRTPRKMSHYPLLFSHYRGSLLSLSAAPELSLPLSFLALLLPRSFLRSPSSPAFTRVHPHSSLANPFSLELHAYTRHALACLHLRARVRVNDEWEHSVSIGTSSRTLLPYIRKIQTRISII